MTQEFTERQEGRIQATIDDYTNAGQYSVNGPFWGDVLGMAQSTIAETQFRADQFRANGNEEIAAQVDLENAINREVLRRLQVMS